MTEMSTSSIALFWSFFICSHFYLIKLRQLKIDTPKGPRMFSQGGIIERSDNYNTQRAI